MKFTRKCLCWEVSTCREAPPPTQLQEGQNTNPTRAVGMFTASLPDDTEKEGDPSHGLSSCRLSEPSPGEEERDAGAGLPVTFTGPTSVKNIKNDHLQLPWNWHNIANQLYFNFLKAKNPKPKKICFDIERLDPLFYVHYYLYMFLWFKKKLKYFYEP